MFCISLIWINKFIDARNTFHEGIHMRSVAAFRNKYPRILFLSSINVMNFRNYAFIRYFFPETVLTTVHGYFCFIFMVESIALPHN